MGALQKAPRGLADIEGMSVINAEQRGLKFGSYFETAFLAGRYPVFRNPAAMPLMVATMTSCRPTACSRSASGKARNRRKVST